MNTLVRILIVTPAAILVTGGIFFLLATVIGGDGDVALDDGTVLQIHVTRQLQDRTETARQIVDRPVLDQPPPPPPNVVDPSFRPTISTTIGELPDMSAVDIAIGTGFNPDRDAQPLVRIPPQYPQRCMSRASENESVVLEFNVTPDGSTVNIEVVSSTNSCFDRAAIRSVERWRYNPKIEDGVAQPRFGVRTVIDFGLEGGGR